MNQSGPFIGQEQPDGCNDVDNPRPPPSAAQVLTELSASPAIARSSPWSNWSVPPGIMITTSQQASPYYSVVSASPYSTWSTSPGMMITTSQTTSPSLNPTMMAGNSSVGFQYQSTRIPNLTQLRQSMTYDDQLSRATVGTPIATSDDLGLNTPSSPFHPFPPDPRRRDNKFDSYPYTWFEVGLFPGGPLPLPSSRRAMIDHVANGVNPWVHSLESQLFSSGALVDLTPSIVTFPQSVLKDIFMSLANSEVLGRPGSDNIRYLETLLLVNREWNAVALDFSPLWEQFKVVIDNDTDLAELLRLITRRLGRSSPTPQIKIRIEVSSRGINLQEPLDMVLYALAGPDGGLYPWWTTLHISLLELGSNSSAVSFFSFIHRTFGHQSVRLRSLSIESPFTNADVAYNVLPGGPMVISINTIRLRSMNLEGYLLLPYPEPEHIEEISLARITMRQQWPRITTFPKLRKLSLDVSESLILEAPLLRQLTVNTKIPSELISFYQISHIRADGITHIVFSYVPWILPAYEAWPRKDSAKKDIYEFLTRNSNLQYIEGPDEVIRVVLSWAYETWFGTHRSDVRKYDLCLQLRSGLNAPEEAILLTGGEDLGQLQRISEKRFYQKLPYELKYTYGGLGLE